MSVTLESKNRIAAIIAAAKDTVGGDAGDLTESVQALCDTAVGLVDGTVTDISSSRVGLVRDKAFYFVSHLESIGFPNATSIGESAFWGCEALETIDFPNVTSIGDDAFRGCEALNDICFPKSEVVGSSAFRCASKQLKKADFHCVKNFGDLALGGNPWLETLIIRTPEVCIAGTNVLGAGAGCYTEATVTYIYVPATLIEEYKLATNWVKYAAQFRALEDYTVDGTITGALDESKI